MKRSISTNVIFRDRAEALAEFRKGRDVSYDDDGTPHTYYDGEALPLSDALLKFAYDRRELIDGRTLPRTGAGTARPGLMSKADFPDVKSKMEFISKFGEEAYARLPLTGVATSEVLTQADWLKLPTKEKVRRIAANPNAFSELAPAPPPRPSGAFINHAAIAKAKSLRPGSNR